MGGLGEKHARRFVHCSLNFGCCGGALKAAQEPANLVGGVHRSPPQHPGTGPRPARTQYASRTGADLALAGAFALQVRGILTPTAKALTLPAALLCAGLCMSLFAAFRCAGGPAFSYGRHAFLRAASAHSVR